MIMKNEMCVHFSFVIAMATEKDGKRQKAPEKAPFVRLSKNYRFPSSLSLETTLSSEY